MKNILSCFKEPPSSSNGRIEEYAVYLATRSMHPHLYANVSGGGGHPSFLPVYVGQLPSCVIKHEVLAMAHIDTVSLIRHRNGGISLFQIIFFRKI